VGVPVHSDDTLPITSYFQLLEVNYNIVFIGTRYVHSRPLRQAIGITKFNINTKSIESINSFPFVPTEDTYFGIADPGLISHNNSIYITSTLYNGAFDTGALVVAKHDTSGKCAWIKYINTGNVAFSRAIYGTSDRGLIVLSSFTTVSGMGNPNEDMLILKLNEDGYPLSIVNVSEQLRTGIVIYPNPAQEELHIKGAVTGSVASVYNSVGQLMMQETIRSSDQVFSIQQLASGNYLYQINDKNGQKLSSGKWVKR
jgi:hypothetical protein